MKRYIANKTLKVKPTERTTSLSKKTETVKSKREDAPATNNNPKEKLHPKKQRANRYKTESRQQSTEGKTNHDRHPQPHAVITKNVYPYMKISLQSQPSRSDIDAGNSCALDLNSNSENGHSVSSYRHSDDTPQLRESPNVFFTKVGSSSNEDGSSITHFCPATTIHEDGESLRSAQQAENILSSSRCRDYEADKKIDVNNLEDGLNKNAKNLNDLIDDTSKDLHTLILSAPPKTPEHFKEIDAFNGFLASYNQGIPDLKTNPNEPQHFSQNDIFNSYLAAKNREGEEETLVADQPGPNILLSHAYDGSAYTVLPMQELQPPEAPLKFNQIEICDPKFASASKNQHETLVEDDGIEITQYLQPFYTTGKNYGQFVADTPRVKLAQSTRIPPQAYTNATGFFVETVYNGIHHAKYYELPWLSRVQESQDNNFTSANIGENHNQIQNNRTYSKASQNGDRQQCAIYSSPSDIEPSENFLDEVDGSAEDYTEAGNLFQHMSELKQKTVYQNPKHAYQPANISASALRPYEPPITVQGEKPPATYVPQQHTSPVYGVTPIYDDANSTTEVSYDPLSAQRNNATPTPPYCTQQERVAKTSPNRSSITSYSDFRHTLPTQTSYASQKSTVQAQVDLTMARATYGPQEENVFKIPPNPASIPLYSDFRSTWPAEQSYAPQGVTVQAQRDFIMPNKTYGPQQGTVIEIASNPISAPTYSAKNSPGYGIKPLYSTVLAEESYPLERATVTVQRQNIMPTAMYGPQQGKSFVATTEYGSKSLYADTSLKIGAEKRFVPPALLAAPSTLADKNCGLLRKTYDSSPPERDAIIPNSKCIYAPLSPVSISDAATIALDYTVTGTTKPPNICKPPKKAYIERFALYGNPMDESTEIIRNGDAIECAENNPYKQNFIETEEINDNALIEIENGYEINTNLTSEPYSKYGDEGYDSAVTDPSNYASPSIAHNIERNHFTNSEVYDLTANIPTSVALKEILPRIIYKAEFNDIDQTNTNQTPVTIQNTENNCYQVPSANQSRDDPVENLPKSVYCNYSTNNNNNKRNNVITGIPGCENKAHLPICAEVSVHKKAYVNQFSECSSPKASLQYVQLPRLIVSIPKSRVQILSCAMNASGDGNPLVHNLSDLASEVIRTPNQVDSTRHNTMAENYGNYSIENPSIAPVDETISKISHSNGENHHITNHKVKILSCIINGTEDGSHLIKNFKDGPTEVITHKQLQDTNQALLECNAEVQDEIYNDDPVEQPVVTNFEDLDDTIDLETQLANNILIRINDHTYDENQSISKQSGMLTPHNINDDTSDSQPQDSTYLMGRSMGDIEDTNESIDDHSQTPLEIWTYVNDFDDISDSEEANTVDTISRVIKATENENGTIEEPLEILPSHNENEDTNDSELKDSADDISRSIKDIEDDYESIDNQNDEPPETYTYTNQFDDISDSESENTADTAIRVINATDDENGTIEEPLEILPAHNENADVNDSKPKDTADDLSRSIKDIADGYEPIDNKTDEPPELLTYINQFDDISDLGSENTVDTVICAINATEDENGTIKEPSEILVAHSEKDCINDSEPKDSADVMSRSIKNTEDDKASIDNQTEEPPELLTYINQFDDISDSDSENTVDTVIRVINATEDENGTIKEPSEILVDHSEKDCINDSEPKDSADVMSRSIKNTEDDKASIDNQTEEYPELLTYIDQFDDISDSDSENTVDTVIRVINATEDENGTIKEPSEILVAHSEEDCINDSEPKESADVMSRSIKNTEDDKASIDNQTEEPPELLTYINQFDDISDSDSENTVDTVIRVINATEDENGTIKEPSEILAALYENDDKNNSEPKDSADVMQRNNGNGSIDIHTEDPPEILTNIDEFDYVRDSDVERPVDTISHFISATEDGARTIGELSEILPAQTKNHGTNESESKDSVDVMSRSIKDGNESIANQTEDPLNILTHINEFDDIKDSELETTDNTIRRVENATQDENGTIENQTDDLAEEVLHSIDFEETSDSAQQNSAEMLSQIKNNAEDENSLIEKQNAEFAHIRTDRIIQSTSNANELDNINERMAKNTVDTLDHSINVTNNEDSPIENDNDELTQRNRHQAIFDNCVEPSRTLTSLNKLDDINGSEPQSSDKVGWIVSESRETPLAENPNNERQQNIPGNNCSNKVTQPSQIDNEFCCTTESIPKITIDLLKHIKTENDELVDGDGTQSSDYQYNKLSGVYEDISEDDLSDSDSQNPADGTEDESQSTEKPPMTDFELVPTYARIMSDTQDVRTEILSNETESEITASHRNQSAENYNNQMRGSIANLRAGPVQRTTSEILSSIIDFLHYKSFDNHSDEPSDDFYNTTELVPSNSGIYDTDYNIGDESNIAVTYASEFNNTTKSVPKTTVDKWNRDMNKINYESSSIHTNELVESFRNESIDHKNVPSEILIGNNEYDNTSDDDTTPSEPKNYTDLSACSKNMMEDENKSKHTENPSGMLTDFNEYDGIRDPQPQNTNHVENQLTKTIKLDTTKKTVSIEDANQSTVASKRKIAKAIIFAPGSCNCAKAKHIRTFIANSGEEKTKELKLTFHEEKCPHYRSYKDPFVEVKLSQVGGTISVRDYNEAKGYVHRTHKLCSPILLFKIVTTRIDATINNLRSGKGRLVGRISNFQEFVSDTATGVLKVDTKKIKALFVRDKGILGLIAGTIYPGEYVVIYTIAFVVLEKLRKRLDLYFSTRKIEEDADEETNSEYGRGPSKKARKKRVGFVKQLLEYLCFESRKAEIEMRNRSYSNTGTIFPDIEFSLHQPQKVRVAPESVPQDSTKYMKGLSSKKSQEELLELKPKDTPDKSQEASSLKIQSKRRRFDTNSDFNDFNNVIKEFLILGPKNNEQRKCESYGAMDASQLLSEQQNGSNLPVRTIGDSRMEAAHAMNDALNSGQTRKEGTFLDVKRSNINGPLSSEAPETPCPRIKENSTKSLGSLNLKRSGTSENYAPAKKLRRVFQCEDCNADFLQESTLEVHQLQHQQDMPHECLICEQRFLKKPDLNRHLRLHSALRTYICTICKTGFANPTLLSNHCKSHAGPKPQPCSFCRKTFITKSFLRLHLAAHVL